MSNPFKKRNPWPIAIIGYFVICITFIVSFTVFATKQKMDLVAEDYYDQEIRFQKQIDRVSRTQPVRTDVTIDYDLAKGSLTVALPTSHLGNDISGQIHFYRPADAKLDQTTKIAVDVSGKQTLNVRDLQPGLWKVRVQWTREKQDYFFEKPIVIGS